MIRSKSLIVIINFIMLSSMVLGLIAPVAELGIRAVSAQESTQEPDAAAVEATEPVEPTAAPTKPPTSVPTEVPPTATDVPQVAPLAAEATEEPAAESTEPVVVEATEAVQPEATEEPENTAEPTSDAESTIEPTAEQTQEATTEPTETAAPTLDPALTTFADDFEDGDTIGWTLSPGWALTTSASGDNLLLRGVMPDSTAAINELDWPQLNLKARVRVQPGSTLEIAVRQQEDDGYRVTLDATGLTALYRGDSLLAQGAAIDPEITAAVWRTIVVQALGGNVIVALDDSVQFTYEDPTSLGAGSVTFKTGADNSGAVDVDDVVITKLEASVLPDESVTATEPAPEITETVMPEVTEEATAEVEATEEAEATQEAESTQEPEATEEPVSIPLVAVPVLSADFEGELDGWFASDGAVVVAVDETNQALLMSGGDTLLPASEIVLNDFRLDTRVQFLSDASGGLSLVFHSSDGSSYVLAFEAAQTVLYRSESGSLNPLAVTEAAREAGVWYALSLESVGGQIMLSVDDVETLSLTDEAPLTGGALALAATGDSSFFLDDLALYDLVPQDQLVTPTPLPTNVLTEENGAKLSFRLYQVLQLVEAGDLEGARSLAAESNVQILDDALNVEVTVWPVGDIDLLTPLVEMNGGVILPAQDATHLNVRIPLTGLVAVISAEEVQNVLLPDVAASTSSDFEAALAPANLDPAALHSLSIIGWNDWNLNSITGSGVKVAVIDKAGNHRNAVIEVVKTIAPSATVTAYTANNQNDLDDQINSAYNAGNKIILITMDLGVHVSPGDGTGNAGSTQGTAKNVYDAIQNARTGKGNPAQSRLVIVSAGNNTNRQVNVTYSAVNTQVNMTVPSGTFIVNVAWNGWGDATVIKSNLRQGASVLDSYTSGSRINNNTPGYQLSGSCGSASCNIVLDLNVGGNPTGRLVQVQLNSPGEITGVTGSSINTSTGNIARPADSPYALTVGAVCSLQSPQYYPAMVTSSHGPIFSSGGSGPASSGNTRDKFKPDLVGPSHVKSSYYPDPAYDCYATEPDDGFNGTSAAAAHVAGMAALLMSNSSMSGQIAGASNPADALQDYLQTHTIDLFADADDGFPSGYGFDQVYGAGLTTLGSPSYDLSQITNLESGGNAVYVGQGDPGSPQNGTPTEPYLHLAKAIEEANAQSLNRIVMMPGEYPSGVGILDQTDLSIEGFNAQATIWVNDSYNYEAGFQIQNSTGITIEGLQFLAADPMESPEGVPYPFASPTAIQFENASNTDAGGSVVRNSTFSGFAGHEPVTISRTYGISLTDNVFENIDVSSKRHQRAAIYVSGSPSNTDPVMIRGNTFRSIIGTTDSTSSAYEGIIRIEDSAADLFSNFFVDTEADTVINVTNTTSQNDDSHEVNIFSNLFLNNTNYVVYMNPAPRLRFINNTVVNQGFTATYPVLQALLLRNSNTDYRWALHNNLFYNNVGGSGSIQITAQPLIFSLCKALDNDADETGARNNWVIATQITFGSGTCDKSFEENDVPKNFNILSDDLIDAALIFVGPDPAFQLNPNNDPLYYQVRRETVGIDAGDNSVLIDPLVDFSGNIRNNDGDDDLLDEPDLGAFELVPLTAGPIDVARVEDTFNQSNDRSTAFAVDLRLGVEGGFAPYVFKVKSMPVNFSTDPSDFCLGAGLRLQGNFAYYCPPPQFYTDGTNPNIPDNIQFEYYAFDRLSDLEDLVNAQFNTVTIDIASQSDIKLPAPDINNPYFISYGFIAEAGTAVKFRLRPSVKFDNFKFSENGTSRKNYSDYPFTYSQTISDLDTDNNSLLETGAFPTLEDYINNQIQNPNSEGQVTLQTKNGERGYVEFSYTVTDSYKPIPGTATNHIRLEVVGVLPDRGLHDDSSFNFRYSNLQSGVTDRWEAIASSGSINNTLHRTSQIDDVASFDFVGEAFVGYLQAQRGGSQWELRVDDRAGVKPPLTWAQQTDGSWLAQADGFYCITRAPIINNLISNNGSNAYTVSCAGLLADESHTVQFISRTRGWLAIDAFSILFDGDPLLPGVHDVAEQNVFTRFAGWDTITDRGTSNGIALATTSDSLNDVTFRFVGSGIAIGTTLEGVRDSTGAYIGADYDVCITPQIVGAAGEEVCQNFNNGTGAGRGVSWNVFRPFYGYNYNPTAPSPDEHQVRIHINDIPPGARMIVDSITVFDEVPTAPLDLVSHVTEDDQIGPIVFSNGAPNAWSLNTLDRRASNRSLTSLNRGVNAAGPFIGFSIPADTDLIHLYRSAGRRDSTSLLVCVDRAQGETGITDSCLTFDLRSSQNPLIVRESDFVDGWGTGWGSEDKHTVEIFSLVNEVFNLDKVEIFDSTAPLNAGFYEDSVLAASNNAFGFFDDTSGNPLNGGSFAIIQDRSSSRASGASVARTTTSGEGALFQMTGTGFTIGFTQDRYAGDLKICWKSAPLTTDVSEVEGGNCRTYNNYSRGTSYQVGYSVVGLPQGDYTVTVRNLPNASQALPQMSLDFITIADDALPTNLVTDAQARYEPSFTNQAEQDTFLYYGNWSSVEGRRAARYSGENYDYIQRSPGTGIVFQTEDIDVLRIMRTVRRGYADIQVCVDGTSSCTDFTYDRDPVLVRLPDKNAHVVSIILLNGGRFELDAIDVFDSSTPLQPGIYEDDDPLLSYDANWTNRGSRSYTNSRAQRTLALDAEMTFQMDGSMLELGTYVRGYEQVEICFATGSDNIEDNCDLYPANLGQSLRGRQDILVGPFDSSAGTYTIRVRNKLATELLIDFIQVIDSFNPLPEGRYENDHPVIIAGLNNGSANAWTTLGSRAASDGTYLRTQVADDFLQFEIEGTGFGIGTFTDHSGSEMLVCYAPSDSFGGDWSGADKECVTFQNETARSSTSITRAITGLPDDTYTVGVFNLNDDNESNLTVPPTPRDLLRYPPTLVIDFVEVYSGSPALLSTNDGGTYNDNAVNGSEDAYMQLLPADRWNTITDRSASGATEGSYASVLDARGRVTNGYAGPTATFQVQLPASSTSTFILDLVAGDRRNSDQLQYCIVGGDSNSNGIDDIDCATLTTAQSERYQVLTLENPGSETTRRISFSNLTPGYLRIDGYQFVPGNILGVGLYEDLNFTADGLIDVNGTGWQAIANRRYSNSSARQTTVADDSLQFTFKGTGFSIGTETGITGSEVEICYQTLAAFDGDFTDPEDQCLPFQNEISRGSSNVSRSVAGLPADTYVVGIFNRDDLLSQRTVPETPRDELRYPPTLLVDYIEIFATPWPPPTLDMNASGGYNEDAGDGTGPYLQLLPANRWAQITDRSASNATGRSYASVVDTRGRVTSGYAGPTAAVRLQIGANSKATLTLDTFGSGRGHSDQLMYCVLDGMTLVDDCTVLDTMLNSRFQVVTLDNPTGSPITRTLFFQTLTPGYFRIDRFQLLQGNTLGAGIYEDLYIGPAPSGLISANGTGWQTTTGRGFTNGSIWESTVPDTDLTPGDTGDFLEFEFYGTGFDIGTMIGRNGSEMMVCYFKKGDSHLSYFDTVDDEDCVTFQNESRGTSTDVIRSIVGLPEDAYIVGVLNKDNGLTELSNPAVARDSRYPAKLAIDFIQIFDEVQSPALTDSGTYDQTAQDINGDAYLQLLPADRWGTINIRVPRGAAPQNYASIIDTRGRLTNRATGPSATLRITAPANSPVTLALNTYGSGRGHSDQLLYCTLNEAALVDCGTVTTMIDSSQQVIRIDNTGLPETTYTVFMQTMTPGYFRIDSFQVILGDVLTEGLYDNHFFSEDGLIRLDSNANWQMPPTRGTKVRGTIGGEVIRTQTEDAEFTFAFTGSGFSIITIENVYRPQIEICYVPLTEFESNGFESDKTVCRLSASEITRGSYTQYALNFYGLQPNTYKARVKVVGPVTDLRRQWFQMDALVIFADVTSQGALQPGMYDDADLLDNPSVRFAPEVFWGANTRVRSGPPRGPWQLTEQQASNSGAVLQVFVEGNMLTLYQQVTSRNSNDVQACLVVFGTKANELQCNNFSQSGRGTYFTPVAFFGLGEGEHQIILENKAPRRNFNVDAIRVAP